MTNHQVRLAARPVGLPKRSDWSFTEEAVPEPAEGQMLQDVVAGGIDAFPETLLKLFRGENFGKLVLQLA